MVSVRQLSGSAAPIRRPEFYPDSSLSSVIMRGRAQLITCRRNRRGNASRRHGSGRGETPACADAGQPNGRLTQPQIRRRTTTSVRQQFVVWMSTTRQFDCSGVQRIIGMSGTAVVGMARVGVADRQQAARPQKKQTRAVVGHSSGSRRRAGRLSTHNPASTSFSLSAVWQIDRHRACSCVPKICLNLPPNEPRHRCPTELRLRHVPLRPSRCSPPATGNDPHLAQDECLRPRSATPPERKQDKHGDRQHIRAAIRSSALPRARRRASRPLA